MQAAANRPLMGLLRDEWRGRPYLLSPVLDVFMAGGGALIALLLFVLFIPAQSHATSDIAKIAYLAAWVYWLSFAVNYPHFLVSYQLLYRNFPKRLSEMQGNREMWWRTVNAGLIAPLLLVVLLAYAGWMSSGGNKAWIGLSIAVMQFTVGWHYTKQAYGVFMVCSALKKTFYTSMQRRMLVANAYAVWLFSWMYMSYFNLLTHGDGNQGTIGVANQSFYYPLFHVPDIIRIPMLLLATITTIAACGVIISQWRKTGRRPSVTAVTGYLSMYYLWVFMNLAHPEWVLVAPFFHSLQYLLFVWAYRKGEVHTALKEHPEAAKRIRNRTQEFFAFSFLLGALGFVIIPTLLDAGVSVAHPGMLPKGLFMLFFAVFINVHHFFIDNVIWRRENKDVSQYLLGWRMAPRAA